MIYLQIPCSPSHYFTVYHNADLVNSSYVHVHFEPLYVCMKTLDIIQRLYQTKNCTFKEEHLRVEHK